MEGGGSGPGVQSKQDRSPGPGSGLALEESASSLSLEILTRNLRTLPTSLSPVTQCTEQSYHHSFSSSLAQPLCLSEDLT